MGMQRKHTIVGGLKLDQQSLPTTDEEAIPLVRKVRRDTGRTHVAVPRVMGVAIPPKDPRGQFGGW